VGSAPADWSQSDSTDRLFTETVFLPLVTANPVVQNTIPELATPATDHPLQDNEHTGEEEAIRTIFLPLINH